MDLTSILLWPPMQWIKKSNPKGNYQELENILVYAAIFSETEDRKEILPKDLKFVYE